MRALSSCIVPLILVLIVSYALIKRVNIFDAFLSGAKEGALSLFSILPALVGLITAISMFRASGALSFLINLLAPLTSKLGIPGELMPLALLRPISGSGALSIVQDTLTEFGADSFLGRAASVVMGSSETTFYALAVYFGAVSITRSRHTVPAAILADITGLFAGIYICKIYF